MLETKEVRVIGLPLHEFQLLKGFADSLLTIPTYILPHNVIEKNGLAILEYDDDKIPFKQLQKLFFRERSHLRPQISTALFSSTLNLLGKLGRLGIWCVPLIEETFIDTNGEFSYSFTKLSRDCILQAQGIVNYLFSVLLIDLKADLSVKLDKLRCQFGPRIYHTMQKILLGINGNRNADYFLTTYEQANLTLSSGEPIIHHIYLRINENQQGNLKMMESSGVRSQLGLMEKTQRQQSSKQIDADESSSCPFRLSSVDSTQLSEHENEYPCLPNDVDRQLSLYSTVLDFDQLIDATPNQRLYHNVKTPMSVSRRLGSLNFVRRGSIMSPIPMVNEKFSPIIKSSFSGYVAHVNGRRNSFDSDNDSCDLEIPEINLFRNISRKAPLLERLSIVVEKEDSVHSESPAKTDASEFKEFELGHEVAPRPKSQTEIVVFKPPPFNQRRSHKGPMMTQSEKRGYAVSSQASDQGEISSFGFPPKFNEISLKN